MSVDTVSLRQNHTISRVIKGGWQLAGDHGAVDRRVAIADMEAFFDVGITTFDCADIYIGVEEMIGDFIADIRRRRGNKIAERVCVHTKLVPDFSRLADIRDDEIEAIVDRSLKRLKIDRLHLVQFYWWDLSIGNAVVSLQVLKRLQDKGKIRSLAVTNWDAREVDPFIEAGFDIVSAQVQYSVLDHRPAGSLTDWGRVNDVQFLCYGTLAGGFLTDKWLGKADPGFNFKNRSLVKYRLIIDEFGPWGQFQDLLAALQAVGDKHRVSLSSVAIRYVLDQPQVAAAIVGARYAHNLAQTLEVFEFSLDKDDRDALAAVIDRAKGPGGGVYALERDRTSRHGRIMKYNLNSTPDTPVIAEDVNHG